jgi:hypothetical protein
MPPKEVKNRGSMPQTGFFNPERIPALVPKYANKVGKTIDKMVITYSPEGVNIMVIPKGDELKEEGDPSTGISLAEFHERLQLENMPSPEEKLRSLRNKFELRLNREFPTPGPTSGSDANIQAWLAGRPFAERRALLMSQKDFEKSYPEGFRA